MAERFRFVLRTPHEDVFDDHVRGVRVPTETGQAGLRPRGEPVLLVVEPGLLVLHHDAGVRFAATAGGLLESGRRQATLYTPIAVVGPSEDDVLAALNRLLSTPDREVAVRRRLGELERRIVEELRVSPPAPAARRKAREHVG